MKIRRKLFLAFSVYMILALIPSLFAYREMSNLRKHLKPVEIASDLTNVFIEVRRQEKNFLLLKDQDSLQLLRKQIGMLKGDIDDIEADIIREIGRENYGSLRHAMTEYERIVQQLVDNFDLQHASLNELTRLGRDIEKQLSGDDLQTFLVLRRHEKNLIIYRDANAIERFRNVFATLRSNASPELKQYAASAEKLYMLYYAEKSHDAEMRKYASDIQSFAESVLLGEREDIDNLLTKSMYLLLVSLTTILTTGIIINTRLARSIVRPIRLLEKFTQRVATGDFSDPPVIEGSNEITALSTALNQMASRLKDTVNSLELAITNLHDKQGQLVEAEKLASLGRIAAGVAHEINNPLAIINEKAGLMQDILQLSGDFSHKEKFLAQIDGIINSINRCRTITHRLLGFARRVEVKVEPFELNEAIHETVTFLQNDVASKLVRLDLNLSGDIPEIRSDKIQMEQVFLNLIKNAVDAVAEGGIITISTSQSDDRFVRVRISDNGPGIPTEMISHIFEPFFTTKERGKGTGLGLFVSHAILKKLGGKIQVQSERGRGTTFLIDIPVRILPDQEASP
jgi:signal transduction histidine kinase